MRYGRLRGALRGHAQQLEELLAGIDAHLLVNMARMSFEGTLGDEQLLLDDASGLPLGQKRQHLLLARAQSVGGRQLRHPRTHTLFLGRALDKTALFQNVHLLASSFSENSSTVAAKMSTATIIVTTKS